MDWVRGMDRAAKAFFWCVCAAAVGVLALQWFAPGYVVWPWAVAFAASALLSWDNEAPQLPEALGSLAKVVGVLAAAFICPLGVAYAPLLEGYAQVVYVLAGLFASRAVVVATLGVVKVLGWVGAGFREQAP